MKLLPLRFIPSVKPIRFTLPGKIDSDFYKEAKEKISNNPGFSFQSEIPFFPTFKYNLAVITIFLIGLLVYVLRGHARPNHSSPVDDSVMIVVIFGFFPMIFSLVRFSYYFHYLRDERRFHRAFRKAISASDSFVTFMETFYASEYGLIPLRGYLFTSDLTELKQFVTSTSYTTHLAVYKYAKGNHYALLTDRQEIADFIEEYPDIVRMKTTDPIWRSLQVQEYLPLEFGNKKLKKKMMR